MMAVFPLPGWLIGRRLGSPFLAITALLASAAILFNLILLMDTCGLPLTPTAVGAGYLAVCGGLFAWARRSGPAAGPGRRALERPAGPAWLCLIAFALAGLSIAARGVAEPLSGYDNSFRWDYLARLILSRHSLQFYPPFRMQDFDLYPWCDGIPPLASILNFGIYAATGSDAPGWITLRAVAEFLVLGALVHRYSRELWGGQAGWASLGALGISALFVWGLSIEQENGLVAVGLVAMLYLLQRAPEGPGSAGWAGVAAGVAAISREYGLYFVILGAGLLGLQGRRRSVSRFLAAAACVGAPWYLRNWAKTGDPVYPAMGSLFPTNPVHTEIMGDIANFLGFRTSPFPLRDVPWTLLATSGALGILALVGALRLRLRTRGLLLGIALVVALWVWSMPQTAGGWNYSMKVLVPALALAAVLAGWIGRLPGRIGLAAALCLGVLSVDAARRAWLLPDDPFTSPWTVSFDEWRQFRAQEAAFQKRNIWSVLANAAAGRYILVDTPPPFMATIAAGGRATPFMSPRVSALFDPTLKVDEAVGRLRALNVRFVTFSVSNPVVSKLVRRHGVLRSLAEDYAPAADLNGLLIFDLEFLKRKDAKAAP
jgi:hypothetical protein